MTSIQDLHLLRLILRKPIRIAATKQVESQDKKMEAFTSHVNSVVEDSDIRCERANVDFEVLNKLEDQYYELMSVEPRNISFKAKREVKENVIVKIDGFELDQRIEDPPITSDELENMHSELKCEFTRLAEDNLKQLVELVTRNDEKRETIMKLQLQLEALKRENRALQISLRYSKANAKDNESHISRSGWLSISKLFRGCSH
ncbi:KIP1-like [Quillaja saponaria]|uniref:KIP1-like n=1 Tax=Quillaja saponaria TaxID=32244 RepID=A0AAD7VHQ4_QUISA|nr:KIP1-like [Quillaja saponaria]